MNNYAALVAPQERIANIRTKVGRTIQEILLRESRFDIYELLGSIEVLVGSKIYQGLQTSSSERFVFALTWLAREVGTGGFRQYFINSAGDFWKDVLNGLIAIGDADGAAMFRETLSIFPHATPSEDRSTRIEQLDALEETDEATLSDHLNKMTARYFRNPFPKWELVFSYVKQHPDEFDLQNA